MSFYDQDIRDAARDAAQDYDPSWDMPDAADLAECADLAEYGEHDMAARMTIVGPVWSCSTCGEEEDADAPF